MDTLDKGKQQEQKTSVNCQNKDQGVMYQLIHTQKGGPSWSEMVTAGTLQFKEMIPVMKLYKSKLGLMELI